MTSKHIKHRDTIEPAPAPAAEVARWLDEGGPGPEPERASGAQEPRKRSYRVPVLIAFGVASAALFGLRQMRHAR